MVKKDVIIHFYEKYYFHPETKHCFLISWQYAARISGAEPECKDLQLRAWKHVQFKSIG